MATIYDIARHVGVSAGTVSRALSRPEKVLPDTRRRIEQAAAALGYVPNASARTLKTQRSGKILITVPDIGNPFFAQILKGAEETAQAAGYAVLLGDTQGSEQREREFAAMTRSRQADGIILMSHRLPFDLSANFSAKDLPPLVNGCEFTGIEDLPTIAIDDRQAAVDATTTDCLIGEKLRRQMWQD